MKKTKVTIGLRQDGFTLIEVMIALAIVTILATIAIPAYQGYILESRYGTALQDLRQMQLILDDLAGDDDLRAVDGDNTAIRGVYTSAIGAIVIGDAATTPAGTTPWVDPWGSLYRYQRPNTANQVYTVWSFGPDGANNSGGGDDASPD